MRADSWLAGKRGRYEPTGGFLSDELVCGRCGSDLPVQRYQGNPRKWCSGACRVAAYRARSGLR